LYFFRDPDRQPTGPGIVAPADGRVSVIRNEGPHVRVGIFLNVTDVHVIRAPFSAEVSQVTHRNGSHWPAFRKESERNERADIDLVTSQGNAEVSLIAGAVARRVHPYVENGASISRGSRIGHIDFGSRTDVLLPARFDHESLLIEEGDRVRAGESIIARDSEHLLQHASETSC
jgi:phosphatidylserine decarboxylase